VPNPDGGSVTAPPIVYPVGQTVSQAFSVGPYGSAAPVKSGAASFGISAIQYGKNSSYFVPNSNAGPGPAPPPPPPSGAPNKPPFGLGLAAPATQTAIPVIFDTAGIVGTPTLIYEVAYALPPNGTPIRVPATPVFGQNTSTTLYTAVLDNLLASTTYEIFASVRNGFGGAVSPAIRLSTLGGSVAPSGSLSAPVLSPAGTTNSQITMQFNSINVTGNPAPTYYMYWGLGPNQFDSSVSAILVPGTSNTYQALVTGLTSGVNYYFMAYATNGVSPDLLSPQVGPFQTGNNNSPSKAPPTPVAGTITPTSIALTVDISGITGTPTPTYSLNYGSAFPLTNNFAMTVSGTTASATVTNLTPNTAYYFVCVAANGVPINKESNPTAAIWTQTGASAAPKAPPGAFQVNQDLTIPPTNTVISLKVFGISKVTGAPNPIYNLYYNTVTSPATVASSTKIPVTVPTPITTAPIQLAVPGLNAGTKYYFQVVATNGVSPDLVSGTISASTTGTPSPTNTPPSAPPSGLYTGGYTSTTIGGEFDTALITGNPTPAYFLGFSSVAGGPYTYVPTISYGGNSIFDGTATGLTPNTTYYFVAKASNGVAPEQISPEVTGKTQALPPPTSLGTNLVIPFLIQGPRYGSTPGAWTAIDYYVNVGAVGAVYEVGGTAASGQQIFASMYAGTVGDAGNFFPGQSPPTPYAGSCLADVPNAALGGVDGQLNPLPNYSDTYLAAVSSQIPSSGNLLMSWGGYYADVFGLFGPAVPSGYPAAKQPTSQEVVQSMCNTYLGVSVSPNPLNWKNINANNNSSWALNWIFNGVVLDFENIGNGNPINQYPSAQPQTAPTSAQLLADPIGHLYIEAIGNIPGYFWAVSQTIFIGNAPASLSIVQDLGMTNVSLCNNALGTWFPFQTATVAPTEGAYNTNESLALNHPTQLSYMDDIFVQFYNESQDYYPGGQYFANLLACWGFVALKAQSLQRKLTKINLGLSKGNIIPGGGANGVNVNNPAVAAAQGPTPPLDGQTGPPYTYWYPQYATASPPNNTTNDAYQKWPNTGPTQDAYNVAAAINEANMILRTAFNNQALVASDWMSGMGFWAAEGATTMAQRVYTASDPASPASLMPTDSPLPAQFVYCWADASYPAPNPNWLVDSGGSTTFNVPIKNLL
jgi:hypothetical protein